jgi:hypothetical protein
MVEGWVEFGGEVADAEVMTSGDKSVITGRSRRLKILGSSGGRCWEAHEVRESVR